jgi:hypothetical protein
MSESHGYQRLFAELKRRRVFRVMAVYGVVGFVLLQVVDLAVPALLLPEWTYRLVALPTDAPSVAELQLAPDFEGFRQSPEFPAVLAAFEAAEAEAARLDAEEGY